MGNIHRFSILEMAMRTRRFRPTEEQTRVGQHLYRYNPVMDFDMDWCSTLRRSHTSINFSFHPWHGGDVIKVLKQRFGFEKASNLEHPSEDFSMNLPCEPFLWV